MFSPVFLSSPKQYDLHKIDRTEFNIVPPRKGIRKPQKKRPNPARKGRTNKHTPSSQQKMKHKPYKANYKFKFMRSKLCT